MDTGDQREIIIDLGYSQPVRAVTAWSLGGGKAAIYAPSEASLEASANGEEWTALGKTNRPPLTEDGKSLQPVPYRIETPADTNARYVRVRVRRAQGWAMLSEIAVE